MNGTSRAEAAVLFSGGLDSAVLLADAARRGTVQPLYIRTGLAWEAEELAMAERLLRTPAYADRVLPLVALQFDMHDVYSASHWAIRGQPPAFDTPDEDVYLEGRNIILLSKAAVYMARERVTTVMLGPLAGNPFPDASRAFFDSMQTALSTGLNAAIRIETPFAAVHKEDVVRLGVKLGVPFELTLSCMQPRAGQHCGRCSKCRERRDAFREARVKDPTGYTAAPLR